MRYLFLISLFFLNFQTFAQKSFQGVLNSHFTEANGATHTAEILIKENQILIQNMVGGKEKHVAYFIDTKKDSILILTNLDGKKNGLILSFSKLINMYEKHHLVKGFQANYATKFSPTGKSKTENEIVLHEYKNEDATIWCAENKIPFAAIKSILRLAGLWNKTEFGDRWITEAKGVDFSLGLTPASKVLKDADFMTSKEFQLVDLHAITKAMEGKSEFPQILQSFVGF